MNANELADGIENCTTDPLHKQAATMLRQQQAEIEALKSILEQEGIGVGRDLLNGGTALFRKVKNEQ